MVYLSFPSPVDPSQPEGPYHADAAQMPPTKLANTHAACLCYSMALGWNLATVPMNS